MPAETLPLDMPQTLITPKPAASGTLVQLPDNDQAFLLARIDEIGPIEHIQVYDRTRQCTIQLADPQGGPGARELILWDEQVNAPAYLHFGAAPSVNRPCDNRLLGRCCARVRAEVQGGTR